MRKIPTGNTRARGYYCTRGTSDLLMLSSALALLIALSSCSGIDHGFVTLDQPGPAVGTPRLDTASQQKQLAEAKYAGMDAALGYATAAMRKYEEAAINQGRLLNITGATLIPLGTAALGAATLGHSATAAGALGLAGAGTLGTAMWLRNAPAQAAYITGYNSVNCAIMVVLPLKLTKERYTELNLGTDRLSASLPRLRRAIDNLRPLANNNLGMTNLLTQASAIASTGNEALKNAYQLQANINQAAGQLVTTVDQIAGQVHLAVLANQPTLAAIPSMLGGLSQTIGAFSPISLPTPPAKKSGTQQTNYELLLGELDASMDEVHGSSTLIGVIINSVARSNSAERLKELKACGFDGSSLVSPIVIDPVSPIVIEKGKQRVVNIEGGQGPFVVYLPARPKGLSVARDSDRVWSIDATSEAQVGQFTLVVRDIKTDKLKTVEIEVRDSTTLSSQPATPKVPKVPDVPKVAPEPEFDKLAEPDKRRLQVALCLTGNDIDGKWGTKTRGALTAYQATVQPPSMGTLTANQVAALLNETLDSIKQRCSPPGAARNPVADPLLAKIADLYNKDKIAVLVALGDTQVGFVSKTGAVDTASNQVVVTLVVDSVKPKPPATRPSDAAIIDKVRDRAANRLRIDEITKLPDDRFRPIISDPNGLLIK